MAYTESATFPAEQGDPAFSLIVRGGAEITFTDIFDGVPQMFVGSAFEIQEIFEGEIEILEPSLIDVDLRWFPPKYYYGTWSVSDTLPGFGIDSEDRGFIGNNVFKIKRVSRFLIVANPLVPIAEWESGVTDNCNFQLNEVGIQIPPFVGAQTTLSINDSVFKYRNSLQKVPLLNRVFYPKLRFVGLYVNTGCVLTKARYIAQVINQVNVDIPAFPDIVCNIQSLGSCEVQFQNFLDSDSNRFATQGLCQSAIDAPGSPYDPNATPNSYLYNCPIEPFSAYPWWTPGGGGGSSG